MYKKIVLKPAVTETRVVIITPEQSEEQEVGPGYVQLWHNGTQWVDNRGFVRSRRFPELVAVPPATMFEPYPSCDPRQFVGLYVPAGVTVTTAIADLNALTKKKD